MKHFWVFAFVSIIITAFFGGFAFPEKGYAAVTQPDVDLMVTKITNELSSIPNVDNTSATQKSVINYVKTTAKDTFSNSSNLSLTPNGFEFILLKALEAKVLTFRNGVLAIQTTAHNTLTADLNVIALLKSQASVAVSVESGTATPGEASNANAEASATAARNSDLIQASLLNSCGKITDSPFLSCIGAGIAWIIKNIILQIVGFFLWMSANLLNYAMYHGVFKFSEFAPKEIYNIWLVVRQIISLFVFFAGLFVGFMAIIGKSEEFKKYVAFLVVFGLFVNFSYPIVRVFVDVSNIISLQIYQTTLGNNILLTDNPSGDGTAGARIMSSMGLQGLASSATSLSSSTSGGFISDITSLPGAIAVVAVVGSAAYILFMIAVMLIVRTALLVCIIIASPILLVDTIVPALGEKAKWLRGVFISQLFVAPVFAITLALTLKFLDIFGKLNNGPNALTGAGANTASVFFNLIMMLVMLWIMYKVTKTVAGSVGDTVTSWAGKAGGLGTGLAIGAGSMAAGGALRQTAGRYAKTLGDKDWGGGILGNYAKDTFKGLGSAKYDLRNLGATGAIAGTLGISGMGQGAKKGYAENREEYEKESLERAGEIEDDGQREKYLQRKFSTGKFAKFTGTASQNSKAYGKFVKGDEDTMKQYVNADEEGRKKMVADEKNKKYLQRFGNVDKAPADEKAIEKMSSETQRAYRAKLAKDEAQKARNESRIASYLTADQATRESIGANAKASDDKELLKQLDILDQLIKKGAGTITPEDVKGLNNADLAQKVLINDALRKTNLDAQETQRASQVAINEARISANKTAEETNELLKQLVTTNNDFAKQLRDMKSGTTSKKPAAPALGGSPLIIPTTGGAGRSKQPIPVPTVASTSVPPKEELAVAEDEAQAQEMWKRWNS